MSAREFFNNNPAIVTGGAVLVLVLCLAAIACSLFGGIPGTGGSNSVQLIYYDMSNNTIKLISSSERPGSPLADNDQVFRCFVLSCGECGKITDGMTNDELEANGMFVSHLQTFPTVDRMMEPGGMMEDDTQVLMLNSENPLWYGMNSVQGQEIMRAVASWQCEDGSTAIQCQP